MHARSREGLQQLRQLLYATTCSPIDSLAGAARSLLARVRQLRRLAANFRTQQYSLYARISGLFTQSAPDVGLALDVPSLSTIRYNAASGRPGSTPRSTRSTLPALAAHRLHWNPAVECNLSRQRRILTWPPPSSSRQRVRDTCLDPSRFPAATNSRRAGAFVTDSASSPAWALHRIRPGRPRRRERHVRTSSIRITSSDRRSRPPAPIDASHFEGVRKATTSRGPLENCVTSPRGVIRPDREGRICIRYYRRHGDREQTITRRVSSGPHP